MSALAVLLLLGLSLAAVQSTCPDKDACDLFWSRCKGRDYLYVTEAKSWADAQVYCTSKGSNLASLHNADEIKFVVDLMYSVDPLKNMAWIGLSDVFKEGSWTWADGSKTKTLPWGGAQPDNYLGKEHCGNVYPSAFNDLPCDSILPFVCAVRPK